MKSARLVLLISLLFGVLPGLAELPEESGKLLEKLSQFRSEQLVDLEKKFSEKRKVAASLLRRELEEQKKNAQLESAVAINAAIESLEAGETVKSSAGLPEGSAEVVDKLLKFGAERKSEIDAQFAEKQEAVVAVLKTQQREKTKLGNIDQAVAIQETVEELESELAMLGEKSDSRAVIPDDAIEHDGSYFKAYVTRSTIEWDEAREECRKLGGRLAWFDSPSDEDLIRTLLKGVNEEAGHVPVWVGASRADPDEEWMWLNGEPVDPAFWADPSHAVTHEQDIAMSRWIGSFRAYRKDNPRVIGYICRWD